MPAKVDAPTVRQAAEMMPAGPDRDALHARARECYAAGHGPFIERRIAAVERALEMIWAAQEAQRKAEPGQPPVNAREHLRYENQLDRLYRSHDALWEQAFKFAREAIFRESGARLATPIYEAEEHWANLKERLNHDAYYALHRQELEESFRPARRETRPAPAAKKPAPVPGPEANLRELAAGLDQLMREIKEGPPKSGEAA